MRGLLTVLPLLLLLSADANAGSWREVCHTYTGSANWTGPSGRIYVKTNAYFCVSDGKKCSAKGGQLYIWNVSKTEHGTVTSSAAGLHDWPIAPLDKQYHTLAVYKKPGEVLNVDLSVTWCRKELVN